MRTRFHWIACLSVAAFAIVGLSCAALDLDGPSRTNTFGLEGVNVVADPWSPTGSAPNGLQWVICDGESPYEVHIARVPNGQASLVGLPSGHTLEVPDNAFGPGPRVHTVVLVQPRTRYVAVNAHAERAALQNPLRLTINLSGRANCRPENGGALVDPVVVRINPHNGNHTIAPGTVTREPEGTITVSLDSLSTFTIAD
ncbi:MAG TPA: hypothetical protein VMM18_02900 [Gemmatimonadaceae bacterium]|nr:hypothetical protein [Gemmatimonadaceae bacterium]